MRLKVSHASVLHHNFPSRKRDLKYGTDSSCYLVLVCFHCLEAEGPSLVDPVWQVLEPWLCWCCHL